VGLSVDPDGGYLFAFMHAGYGTRYGIYHGVFRLDLGALDTDPSDLSWEDLTTDKTETVRVDRDSNVSNAEWITYAGAPMVPEPHPADRTADIFDGIWLDDADGLGTPGLIAAGGGGVWRVFGLNEPFTSPDTSESATTWDFLSNSDTSDPHTWQLCGGPGVAISPDGDIWADYEDAGPYELVRGDDVASHDCIFQANVTGGGYVSVAQDGAVWIATYDQGWNGREPGSEYPESISVYRSTDGGASWCHQGAEVYNHAFHGEDNEILCRYDQEQYDWRDSDQLIGTPPMYNPFNGGNWTRYAPACDAAGKENDELDEGIAFWEGVDTAAPADGNLEGKDDPSWGNPHDIVAISAEMAIAVFGSYSENGVEHGTEEHDGALGYTVDGGQTWTKVPFDGGAEGCDPWQFFRHANKVSPRLTYATYVYTSGGGHEYVTARDDATWLEDEDDDGTADYWGIGVAVSSRSSPEDWDGDTSDKRGGCAVAYVSLDSASPASPTWTWARLPNAWSDTTWQTGDCMLSGPQVWGVAVSPTTEEAYVWGTGAAVESSEIVVRTGGICSIPLPFDGKVPSGLLKPTATANRFSIYAVAPSPDVAELLFVQPAPIEGSCFADSKFGCDPALPFVLERSYFLPTWKKHEVSATNLPSLMGLGAAWSYLDAEDTYMWAINLSGSGGYYTELTW
jgi:hypothetical protein